MKCGDLISRQAVLDELENYSCLDKKDITTIIKAMPPVENKGEWIPVSERLPEEEGLYLCTVGAEYRKVREMYYAPQAWENKSDKATWRSIDGAYVYDWFIDAWRHLPAPYKEKCC